MPLKTWVDYERLEAADLNSAFGWSQDLTIVGAYSNTDGASTATIAASAYGECKHGAPLNAGQDPAGMYRASDGRLVVPSTGVYVYSAQMRADDSSTSDAVQFFLDYGGGRIQLASAQRRAGTQVMQTMTWVGVLGAGIVLYAEARMLTSGGVAGMRRWGCMRLGRGLAATPGAVPVWSLLERAEEGPELGGQLPETPEAKPARRRRAKP